MMESMTKTGEMRCVKCGAKLCDFAIGTGKIEIMCKRSIGYGQGRCKTINVIQVEKGVILVSHAI